MLYTILALCLGLAMSQNPSVGYRSAVLELADAELGAIYWSDINSYIDEVFGPMSSDSSNGSECLVGASIVFELYESSSGSLWLADSADSTKPVESSMYFDFPGTFVFDQQIFFTYNRCTDNSDIYLAIEAECSGACLNTAEFWATLVLFSGDSLDMFPTFNGLINDASAWANAYLGGPDNEGLDREAVMEMGLYPITHIWPADHPELDTTTSDIFWLGESQDQMGSFGITQWVDWSAELNEVDSNYGLYTRIDADAAAILVPFGVCFNWNFDPIIERGASYAVNSTNIMDYCDFCYPEEDCSFPEDPENSDITITTFVQGDAYSASRPSDATGIYVTTLVLDSSSLGTAHSVCNSWGSECSPAATAAPTLMALALGVVALFM